MRFSGKWVHEQCSTIVSTACRVELCLVHVIIKRGIIVNYLQIRERRNCVLQVLVGGMERIFKLTFCYGQQTP